MPLEDNESWVAQKLSVNGFDFVRVHLFPRSLERSVFDGVRVHLFVRIHVCENGEILSLTCTDRVPSPPGSGRGYLSCFAPHFHGSAKKNLCVTKRRGGPRQELRRRKMNRRRGWRRGAAAQRRGSLDPVGGHRVGMRLVPCVYNQR